MTEQSPREKQLVDMLASQDFDGLTSFSSPESWTEMSSKERELLGMLFIMQGKGQLADNEKAALQSFKLASKVAPKNVLIMHHKAKALASSDSITNYNLACKALKSAIRIKPKFLEARLLYAEILMRIGIYHREELFFELANEVLPDSIQPEEKDLFLLGDFYFLKARCWHHRGLISGEACDFHQALVNYVKAGENGIKDTTFIIEHADAMTELSMLLGRIELMVEANHLLCSAIKNSPLNPIGWLHYALNNQRLYERTLSDQYFHSAHESFSKAVELKVDYFTLWLSWGQLLLEAGKQHRDPDLLLLCCEKLVKANECDENNPSVLKCWSFAQLLYGSYTEKVEQIKSAEAKILRSLELDEEDPSAWYVYGTCLIELGRYFNEVSFYLQGIEKLEHALKINPEHVFAWYSMALAQYALGEANDNLDQLKKALLSFAQVFEYSKGQVTSQFWNDWGVVYLKIAEITDDRQMIDSAIEKFEHIVSTQLANEEHLVCDPEWLYNYGCALDFLGDHTDDPATYEKAIFIFQQILKHDPSYMLVRFNLAQAYAHLGELVNDADLLNKALEQYPIILQEDSEDELSWNEWGLTLLNLAQLINDPAHPEKKFALYEQAESKFSHAIALGGTQAFYNMACLYSLIHNYPAAMHYLERAEMSDSLPPIDEILHDEWLEDLQETADFRRFLSQLKSAD